MSVAKDTIAAIATGPAAGGIGIIRLSGSESFNAATILSGRRPRVRRVELARFTSADGSLIDQGLVLAFSAPHSFTGEDVVELHAHGGLEVLDALLARVLSLGQVRLARPGEFSERAFLNNKIDLVQAEAIMDLIQAGSQQAAKAATRSLAGEFSRKVNDLVERLIHIRVQLEARIDFSDEELSLHSIEVLNAQLVAWQQALASLIAQTQTGVRLREGLRVVIAGAPNAGKSSLLNALLGAEAAIVSAEAGTTRDVIREQMVIDGVTLEIADTAGIRAEAEAIEAEGIRRAKNAMAAADIILYVVDASDNNALNTALNAIATLTAEVILVLNKCDLYNPAALPKEVASIAISAKTGAGIDQLKHTLRDRVRQSGDATSVFMARRRHWQALELARQYVAQALSQSQQGAAIELVAEELWQAQNALAEITGRFISDDLLGKIFGEFCIGK